MKIETDDDGGRVFFSSTGRSLEGEDDIVLLDDVYHRHTAA